MASAQAMMRFIPPGYAEHDAMQRWSHGRWPCEGRPRCARRGGKLVAPPDALAQLDASVQNAVQGRRREQEHDHPVHEPGDLVARDPSRRRERESDYQRCAS